MTSKSSANAKTGDCVTFTQKIGEGGINPLSIIATDYFKRNIPDVKVEIEKKNMKIMYKSNADKKKITDLMKTIQNNNLKHIILSFKISDDLNESTMDDLVNEEMMIKKFHNQLHYPYTKNHLIKRLQQYYLMDSNYKKSIQDLNDIQLDEFYSNSENKNSIPLFIFYLDSATKEQQEQFRYLIRDYLDTSHQKTLYPKSIEVKETDNQNYVITGDISSLPNNSESLEKTPSYPPTEKQKEFIKNLNQCDNQENSINEEGKTKEEQQSQQSNNSQQNANEQRDQSREQEYQQDLNTAIQQNSDENNEDSDDPEGGEQQKPIKQLNVVLPKQSNYRGDKQDDSQNEDDTILDGNKNLNKKMVEVKENNKQQKNIQQKKVFQESCQESTIKQNISLSSANDTIQKIEEKAIINQQNQIEKLPEFRMRKNKNNNEQKIQNSENADSSSKQAITSLKQDENNSQSSNNQLKQDKNNKIEYVRKQDIQGNSNQVNTSYVRKDSYQTPIQEKDEENEASMIHQLDDKISKQQSNARQRKGENKNQSYQPYQKNESEQKQQASKQSDNYTGDVIESRRPYIRYNRDQRETNQLQEDRNNQVEDKQNFNQIYENDNNNNNYNNDSRSNLDNNDDLAYKDENDTQAFQQKKYKRKTSDSQPDNDYNKKPVQRGNRIGRQSDNQDNNQKQYENNNKGKYQNDNQENGKRRFNDRGYSKNRQDSYYNNNKFQQNNFKEEDHENKDNFRGNAQHHQKGRENRQNNYPEQQHQNERKERNDRNKNYQQEENNEDQQIEERPQRRKSQYHKNSESDIQTQQETDSRGNRKRGNREQNDYQDNDKPRHKENRNQNYAPKENNENEQIKERPQRGQSKYSKKSESDASSQQETNSRGNRTRGNREQNGYQNQDKQDLQANGQKEKRNYERQQSFNKRNQYKQNSSQNNNEIEQKQHSRKEIKEQQFEQQDYNQLDETFAGVNQERLKNIRSNDDEDNRNNFNQRKNTSQERYYNNRERKFSKGRNQNEQNYGNNRQGYNSHKIQDRNTRNERYQYNGISNRQNNKQEEEIQATKDYQSNLDQNIFKQDSQVQENKPSRRPYIKRIPNNEQNEQQIEPNEERSYRDSRKEQSNQERQYNNSNQYFSTMKVTLSELILILSVNEFEQKIKVINIIDGSDDNNEATFNIQILGKEEDPELILKQNNQTLKRWTLIKIKNKHVQLITQTFYDNKNVYEYLISEIGLNNPKIIYQDILEKLQWGRDANKDEIYKDNLLKKHKFFILVKESKDIKQLKKDVKEKLDKLIDDFLVPYNSNCELEYNCQNLDLNLLQQHIDRWNNEKKKFFIQYRQGSQYSKIVISLHSNCQQTDSEKIRNEFTRYLERFFNAFGFIIQDYSMKDIAISLKKQYVSRNCSDLKIDIYECDESLLNSREDINQADDQKKYSFYKSIKGNKIKKSDNKNEQDDDNQNKKIIICIKCIKSQVNQVISDVQNMFNNISPEDQTIQLNIESLKKCSPPTDYKTQNIYLKLLASIFNSDLKRFCSYRKLSQLTYQVGFINTQLLNLRLYTNREEKSAQEISKLLIDTIKLTSTRIKVKVLDFSLSYLMKQLKEQKKENFIQHESDFNTTEDELNSSTNSIGKNNPNFVAFLKKYNVGVFEQDANSCYIIGLESDCEAAYYFLRIILAPTYFYKKHFDQDYSKNPEDKFKFLVARQKVLAPYLKQLKDLPVQYRAYEIKIYEDLFSFSYYSDHTSEFKNEFKETLKQELRKTENFSYILNLSKQSQYEKLKQVQVQEDLYQRFNTIYILPAKFSQIDKQVTFKFLNDEKKIRCVDYIKKHIL